MAPCLCAPTTHEGSFRCRLHRGLNPPLIIAINSPPHIFASNLQKGASVSSSRDTISVDKPICLVRVRELPFTASTPLHQVSFDLRKTSSPKSLPCSSPLATPPTSPPSPSSSFHHARPPQFGRKAVSLTASLNRSAYPGSASSSTTTSTVALPIRCTSSPSIGSHAAALAIMKHHLHKENGRSQRNRSNTAPRSLAGYKIGPSRLSQMGWAGNTDKRVGSPMPNLPPLNASRPKSSSFNLVEPQSRQSTLMEASPINLKSHSIVAKFKQSDLPCKLVGYKARPFIVPIVY